MKGCKTRWSGRWPHDLCDECGHLLRNHWVEVLNRAEGLVGYGCTDCPEHTRMGEWTRRESSPGSEQWDGGDSQ